MFALRQTVATCVRSRSTAARLSLQSNSTWSPLATTPYRSYHSDGVLIAPSSSWAQNCTLANTTVADPPTTTSFVQSSLDLLQDFVWNMSSTLKKRKAKMNKHKLRKRRKKNRKKTKKV